MHDTIKCKIVKFEDGMYFNGVKGKVLRKTNSFKDAKIMNEISDRDKKYLSREDIYIVLEVEISLEVMTEQRMKGKRSDKHER